MDRPQDSIPRVQKGATFSLGKIEWEDGTTTFESILNIDAMVSEVDRNGPAT